jgi:hypothetical protein
MKKIIKEAVFDKVVDHWEQRVRKELVGQEQTAFEEEDYEILYSVTDFEFNVNDRLLYISIEVSVSEDSSLFMEVWAENEDGEEYAADEYDWFSIDYYVELLWGTKNNRVREGITKDLNSKLTDYCDNYGLKMFGVRIDIDYGGIKL